MFTGREFVFSVSRQSVQANTAPLLILMGLDVAHPTVTSREIALLAPNAELVEDWPEILYYVDIPKSSFSKKQRFSDKSMS